MNYASIFTNFPGIAAARIPQDVHVFFDDFYQPLIGAEKATTWLATLVGAGTTHLPLDGTDDTQALAGGILAVVASATAADGANLTAHGESFQIKDGYPLYFETRWQSVDASDINGWVGLTNSDTEIVAGGVTESVGFEIKLGVIYYTSSHTTEAQTSSGLTLKDATFARLAFFFDGVDTITFYVDLDDDGGFVEVGKKTVSTTAHYVPENVMLTPTIEVINAATGAETAYIDYILCAQQRYKA